MSRTVLFLHSSAGRYGADLQLLALAGGLDRRLYNPVAVLPERGELAPMLEEAGVEVATRPLAVLRRRLMSPAGLRETAARLGADRRELAAFARARGAVLVHSNTSVVLAGQPVAERAGAAHVVHVRELYEGALGRAGTLVWPLQRRRLLRAHSLVCVSEAVRAQFRRSTRAAIIHDGLPRRPQPAPRGAARAELGLPEDAFVVALLGRISAWKGQDVLARSLAREEMAEIGAIGLVAGDPYPGEEHQEERLRSLAGDLGLGGRLRLLGFRDDVDTVLGAADAAAVPSTRPDPLPNAALEAAAAGLPVVAARHGGLPEIVEGGRTGLLVRPGDAAALAAALRTLADDPPAARTLGEAGAALATERFSRERMLSRVHELYAELLG